MTEMDIRKIRFLSQVRYLQRSNIEPPRNSDISKQFFFESCSSSNSGSETTFEFLVFKLIIEGEEHYLYLKVLKPISQYQDIYDVGKENRTDFSGEYLYKVILFKLVIQSEYANLLLPAEIEN